MRPFAAVAILHARQDDVGRVAVVEEYLANARHAVLRAEDERILLPVLANRVEVHLHEEVAIGLGLLAAGIARVPETVAVGGPGKRPARRRILDARDCRADLITSDGIEDVQRAVLTAALR